MRAYMMLGAQTPYRDATLGLNSPGAKRKMR
jgi:hypothetical protein